MDVRIKISTRFSNYRNHNGHARSEKEMVQKPHNKRSQYSSYDPYHDEMHFPLNEQFQTNILITLLNFESGNMGYGG